MTICKTQEEKQKYSLEDLIALNPDKPKSPEDHQFHYDVDYQRIILGTLLRELNMARTNRIRVKPLLFTNPAHQLIWRLCQEHLGKYDALPRKEKLVQDIKDTLKDKDEAVSIYHVGELYTVWNDCYEKSICHQGCGNPIQDDIDKFLDIQMMQVGMYKVMEAIKREAVRGEQADGLIQDLLLDQRRALRTNKGAGLKAYSPAEFLAMPRARFIVAKHVQEKTLGMIYGPSGVGKSFFALDMAFSVGRGVPLFGKFATKRGKVLYLVSEAAGCFPTRIEAYLKHHDLDPAQVSNVQLVPASFDFQKPDVHNDLAAVQLPKDWQPDLVFVDTVFVNLRGDDNAPKDMANFIGGCHKIMEHFGCAVVGVHHEGKNKLAGARGHTSLFAACQSVLALDGEADEITFAVKCKKLTASKPFANYTLEKTVVELDPEDGDNPDSVVLTWLGNDHEDDDKLGKFVKLFADNPAKAETLASVLNADTGTLKSLKWTTVKTLQNKATIAVKMGLLAVHPDDLPGDGKKKTDRPYRYYRLPGDDKTASLA